MSKETIMKVNTDLLECSINDKLQYKDIKTIDVCGMNNKDYLDFLGELSNVENIIIHNASNVIVDTTLSIIKNQQNIKSLILDNVKIPRLKLIENMTSISMLSFNNIKDKRLYRFLKNYKNKSFIQYLSLENVELIDFDFSIIEKYLCLKIINLNNIDTNWNQIDSLFNLNFVEKINIHINNDDLEKLTHLLKQLKSKSVPKYCTTVLKINSEKKNNYYNAITFKKDGHIEARISTIDIKKYISLIDIKIFDELVLFINSSINFNQYLKALKQIENLKIIIPNCSMLTTRKAEFLNQNLNISSINLFDFDEYIYSNTQKNNYEINDYIRLRKYIDSYINNISFKPTKIEKFLTLYYRLGKDIYYSKKSDNTPKDEFKMGLIEKKCNSVGFALILKNLSACMGIKTNLVAGKYGNKTLLWNQVELDRKWYNVDLANDSVFIKRKKESKYCLLSNEDMQKTHFVSLNNIENCMHTYNASVIKRFFRFGKIIDYKAKLYAIISKLNIIIKSSKIKRLTDGK